MDAGWPSGSSRSRTRITCASIGGGSVEPVRGHLLPKWDWGGARWTRGGLLEAAGRARVPPANMMCAGSAALRGFAEWCSMAKHEGRKLSLNSTACMSECTQMQRRGTSCINSVQRDAR
eukprot:350337-Chlamydomonas_euryale.AAC.4